MGGVLEISPAVISDDGDCYVIAEIGHNHQGNLDTAFQLFRAAKEAGASAVKIQKRDNRTLYTRELFEKPYENENSFGATYGEHREALEFGLDEYRSLQQYAEEIGITFFATAFDFPSADFLASIEMPAYKIASGDLRNIPLMRHVAQIGKPMVISTGAANFDDVQRAYDEIMPINPQLCIMQCTAGYPAEFEELNLRVIETYQSRFQDVVVGWSGHDNGIAMAVVAYVLGARVVEKHFTLNRAMKGTDHKFSLEPVGLRKMVRDLRRARVALGDGIKRALSSEEPAYLKMGKKLVASRPLPEGHVITREDIAIKSPGDGVPPSEIDSLIGRILLRAVPVEESFSLDMAGDVSPSRVSEKARK